MRAADATSWTAELITALSFEEAQAALEQVVTELEAGQLSLDDALATYQAGRLLQEHCRAKLGGSDQSVPFALRATTIYRREEDGVWRICHRHADPITTPRPIESLFDQS